MDSPGPFYRAAFLGAVILAFALLGVLAHRQSIEAAFGQPAVTVPPPCRLEAGQVAHITVRLDAGELVAQCRIVSGRKS